MVHNPQNNLLKPQRKSTKEQNVNYTQLTESMTCLRLMFWVCLILAMTTMGFLPSIVVGSCTFSPSHIQHQATWQLFQLPYKIKAIKRMLHNLWVKRFQNLKYWEISWVILFYFFRYWDFSVNNNRKGEMWSWQEVWQAHWPSNPCASCGFCLSEA